MDGLNMNNFTQSFSTRRITRFGSGGAIYRGKEALSDDIIRQVAPSVFAETKHESRSDKYTYIPTSQLLAGLRKEGFAPFEVRQGGTKIAGKKEFTKHMVRLRHESSLLAGDELFRELILLNSHDGSSSYQLMSGLFRMVCSNGLIKAQGDAKCIRIPHKGDILHNVIEGAYEIIEDSKNSDEQIKLLQNTILTPQEQNIFAESAGFIRFDLNSPVESRDILRPRRHEDTKSDLWTVFNRVQENLINGGLHYVQRDENGRRIANRYTRPVQAVDGNVKLNQALWSLASKMEQLKNGSIMSEAA